jgi:hypothetical protein
LKIIWCGARDGAVTEGNEGAGVAGGSPANASAVRKPVARIKVVMVFELMRVG